MDRKTKKFLIITGIGFLCLLPSSICTVLIHALKILEFFSGAAGTIVFVIFCVLLMMDHKAFDRMIDRSEESRRLRLEAGQDQRIGTTIFPEYTNGTSLVPANSKVENTENPND